MSEACGVGRSAGGRRVTSRPERRAPEASGRVRVRASRGGALATPGLAGRLSLTPGLAGLPLLRGYLREEPARYLREHLRVDIRSDRGRQLRLLVEVRRSSSLGTSDFDFQLAPVFRVLAVPDLSGTRVGLGGELIEDAMQPASL